MIKTITKVGNSSGIIFDRALLDLARLKPGDQVNVTVRPEGTIILEPMAETITPDRAQAQAREIIGRNAELFRRLSQ
jgi:antitoxin component of MazEF toxin-antitoxin module